MELLVALLILGVLTAIVVPVMLTQRAKALDAATRSDTAAVGKQIATYYADALVPPSVLISAGHYRVDGVDVGAVSQGVQFGTAATPPSPTATVDTSAWTPTTWCVTLLHPDGSRGAFHYSSTEALQPGACP